MAHFRNYADFWGDYGGSHDGRRARLQISDTMADSPWPTFLITFRDLDRNQTYRNLHQQRRESSDGKHVLTDVQLNEVNDRGRVTFRKLLVHTWNTDFLTGISVWSGREFGGCDDCPVDGVFRDGGPRRQSPRVKRASPDRQPVIALVLA